MKSFLVGLALACGALAAQAALVTYNMSATLSEVSGASSLETTTPSALGAAGSGTLVFDTAAPGTFVSASFSFGSVTVTIDGALYGFLDNVVGVGGVDADFLYILHWTQPDGTHSLTGAKDGSVFNRFYFTSDYGPSTNLDGTGVPDASELDPALWPGMRLSLDFLNDQGGAFYTFAISAITEADGPNEVPEPASVVLAGIGLVGIAALRRRRPPRR